MTARDMLAQMFKPGDDELIADRIRNECPNDYGYRVEHQMCGRLGSSPGRCAMCWDQEIIENKEKENENMSDDLIEKAYDEKYKNASASSHMYDIPERTDATKYETNSLDYKAEYERLKTENEKLKCCYDVFTRDVNRLTDRVNVYRHIIKTVEAMTGRDILEED